MNKTVKNEFHFKGPVKFDLKVDNTTVRHPVELLSEKANNEIIVDASYEDVVFSKHPKISKAAKAYALNYEEEEKSTWSRYI